ncbi:glycoside hydrolase family 3 C-terminal domain-containing protein, partial [bacterium]|nr:glycoside hydrolase family 3 C-terminal domain-containing protein [bacterium]
MKNRIFKLSALLLTVALAVVSVLCLSLNSKAMLLDRKGKYYADFDTKAEALEYADELNIELSAEGNVLLKNNGILPLAKGSKVSVFGRAQNSLIGGTAGMGGGATVGGTGTIGGVLYDSGFQINPTVDQLYASGNGGIGVEKDINPAKDSFFWYNDAAFIVLSRTGGEGKDLDLVTSELAVLENAQTLVVGTPYDLASGSVIEYDGEYYYTTSAFKTDVASTKEDVKAAATLITPTPVAVGDKKINIATGTVVSNGGFTYELAAPLMTADYSGVAAFLGNSENATSVASPTSLVIGQRTSSQINAGAWVIYDGKLYQLANRIANRTTLSASNIATAIGENPGYTITTLVLGDEAAEFAAGTALSYNGAYYVLLAAYNYTPDTVGLTAELIAAACTAETKITPAEVEIGVEKNYAKGEYCLVDAAIYKFNNAFRLIGTTKGITLEQIKALVEAGNKAYADGFEHAALGKQGAVTKWNLSNAMGPANGQTGSIDALSEGPYVKHYLQLTNSEKALIENVKANFKNIVIILNTSNAMEVGDLQDDPAIGAIIWIGRPGSTGLKAFGKIINGEVNPSGRLADEWFRDFTADPTWQNYAKNIQVGSAHLYIYDYTSDDAKAHSVPTPVISSGTVAGEGFYGIDYDEDIYLGYGYAETVYQEILNGNIEDDPATGNPIAGDTVLEMADNWFHDNVVYPFGYGLSYSNFKMTVGDVYYKTGNTKTKLAASVSPALFSSAPGAPAQVEKLYVPVTVTNVSGLPGKQVVQIYVRAPYIDGEIEKTDKVLVGFEKTNLLAPGVSQTLEVAINVQDFASFDWKDANDNDNRGYELDPGAYEIIVASNSHEEDDSYAFTISGADAALLKIDDFSHNEIIPLFSNHDMYDSLRINYPEYTGDKEWLRINTTDANQVLLSRSDMNGTYPETQSIAERTVTNDFIYAVLYYNNYWNGGARQYWYDDQTSYYYSAYASGVGVADWYKTEEQYKALMAGWTQISAVDNNETYTQLHEMSGINLYMEDGSINPLWTTFMNQLTWKNICDVVNHGSHTTYAVSHIGKKTASDENGPNSFNGKSWCDEVVQSSTWNKELLYEYGVINGDLCMLAVTNPASTKETGWYGPGLNNHRSPFGGRNNEYFSQDGIHGGYVAAAVVSGAQSRGVNVYIKHMYGNDQEENRSREALFTWFSEAAQRQIYAKSFQMAMQEGGATGCMTALNRIGRVVSSANYNFITRLVRDEWGWEGAFVTDYYGNNSMVQNNMDLLLKVGCDLPDGTASSGQDPVSGTWGADKVGVGTELAPSGAVYYNRTVYPDLFSTGSAYAIDDTVEYEGKFYKFTAAHAAGAWNAEEATEVAENTLPKADYVDLSQWYYARMVAMRVLYVAANTLNNENGVRVTGFGATYSDLAQGTAANLSIAIDPSMLNGETVTYAVTSGTLPAGLSLNATTGAITGTPLAVANNTSVTISYTVAKYIIGTGTFRFTVASSFALGEGEDAASTGTEYTGTIAGLANASYALAEGSALPAGLTLANTGAITGTPTKSGTFNFTVNATVGSGNNAKVYPVALRITVTGEDIVQPEMPQYIAEEGYL